MEGELGAATEAGDESPVAAGADVSTACAFGAVVGGGALELVGRTGGGPVAFAILSAQVSDAGAPLFSPAGEVGAA